VRPCEAITMTSQPHLRAVSRMPSAARRSGTWMVSISSRSRSVLALRGRGSLRHLGIGLVHKPPFLPRRVSTGSHE
jgi:hypothetical protein